MRKDFDSHVIRAALHAMPVALILLGQPAAAQDAAPVAAAAAPAGGLEDIVVTARKRQESVQDVPVVVTALPAQMIVRQDLTSIEKIAQRTPSLQVGRASNGSGAQLTLRGIGSSSTSIGIEQSVATVVDGAYYGQGRIINEGFFDLSRVEILKGPQALFFGKNATAGVISITTADPGDQPEYIARARYEFGSQQVQGEAIASTPITDTFGIRVALRGSKMYGGYYENVSAPRTFYTTQDFATVTPHTAPPASRDGPGEKELLGRITLKWKPTDTITDTLKASGDYNTVNNNSWNYVAYHCPTGTSALTGYACGEHFVTHQNNMPADIAATFPDAKKSGSLYNTYKSWQVTNTFNYKLDQVTITNVTNYNWNNNRWACACDFQSSNASVWASEHSTYHAFSSETRALTSYDGPVNLLVGVLYQSTRRTFQQQAFQAAVPIDGVVAGVDNPNAPAPDLRYVTDIKNSATKGETVAGFGQVIWKVVPTVEATAGVRYTHETKDSYFVQPYIAPPLQAIFVQGRTTTANQVFNDWSPEATLTWKPKRGILAYVSYKTAYKSGGFSNGGFDSALSSSPYDDLTFGPEKARGFEGGVKTTLFDNQLRFNVDAYTYGYRNLQVDFFNSPIFAFQTLTADARTKGIEAEFEYAPRAVRGLNLHGSLNFNRARYTNFPLAPCYAGETPDQGCNLARDATGAGTRQNLDGSPLSVAPKWTGTLGASYDHDLGGDLSYGVSLDARYSSSYLASGFGNPDSRQNKYVSLDASIRLGAANERWEIALIGKNLTNRFYVTGGVDGPFTGSGTGTAAGIHADQLGFGTLPRTVQLQLSAKF